MFFLNRPHTYEHFLILGIFLSVATTQHNLAIAYKIDAIAYKRTLLKKKLNEYYIVIPDLGSYCIISFFLVWCGVVLGPCLIHLYCSHSHNLTVTVPVPVTVTITTTVTITVTATVTVLLFLLVLLFVYAVFFLLLSITFD